MMKRIRHSLKYYIALKLYSITHKRKYIQYCIDIINKEKTYNEL